MTHFLLVAIACVLLGCSPMAIFCLGWWVLELDSF